MFKVLATVVFLFSTSTFASERGYDLKIEVSKNGKKISSPGILVKDGQNGSITEETQDGTTFIDVVATEGQIQNQKGILMKFVVGFIGKDGKRTITARPEVLAKENSPAQITVGGNNGKESLSMSIVVQRKTL
ncbi:hypothetical protein [Bdellovibrio bacteriovorus]|uniref:hypothetical protein n=1 Tax=Bdellovibrio TaxID=958 RepID=UPI0035A92ACD